MKYPVVVLAFLAAVVLSGCGASRGEVREHMNSWVGQTDTALTGTFGVPQKTLDMSGGSKVYHYDIDNKGFCLMDFQVDSKQIVTKVQLSGSDVDECPHKLPAGQTF
jgi:hypothetical protein